MTTAVRRVLACIQLSADWQGIPGTGGRMFYRRNTISISVSRRVLWVDSEAYPLQNIARVMPKTLKPSFAKILKLVGRWFLVMYVLLIGYALFATEGQTDLNGFTLYSTEGESAVAPYIRPAVLLFLAALLFAVLIRVFLAITGYTLYQLSIETAGTPYAVLASPKKELVSQISHSIMEAIDNPEAEFQFQVENFHVGDSITQFGNANTGKVTG
ncbi:DUF6232 family protein [Streptomyces canus]|uniref:DUF6232 family protein n=1 Tax=Streptomyces canus TaxID=58343 RepID=UPI0033A1F06C